MNKLDEEEGNFTSERNICKGGERCGYLLEYELLSCSKAYEQVVITAYLLVASVFGKKNWAEGYRWVHSQLRGNHESLANQIEIEQTVKNIKGGYFDSAIKILKSFN